MIHVAVAVIRNQQGQVLLSKRRQGTHLEGMWEFPGGKLEPTESLSQALKRELHEEVGLSVIEHRPLIKITHHYKQQSVLLDVHLVNLWRGTPHGKEGQEIRWVEQSAFDRYQLPEADIPIITAIRLPSAYAISPSGFKKSSDFTTRLISVLEKGVRLVQLRLPGYTIQQQEVMAQQAKHLCDAYAARLMVKDEALALQLGCGLHMNSRALMQLKSRPDVDLVAASCHNRAEIQQAQSIGINFITLSPIQATSSHPEAELLGWERFSELVNEATLPVFALGGVGYEDLERSWNYGAQGIAGISGLWANSDNTSG